jgi:putative membrane protein
MLPTPRNPRISPRFPSILPLTTALVLVSSNEAWAHRAPLDRRVDWYDWNSDPVIWLSLTLVGGLYLRGLVALWGRASVGRGVSMRQVSMFVAGFGALSVALLTPLDLLSDQLAWVHMVQHMILMTVAAPLIVSGAPLLVCLWGLAPRDRQLYGRFRHVLSRWRFPWRQLWNPLLVWAIYAMAMWVWHVPKLYQAALRYQPVHDLQHVTFFVAACWFWRVLLDPLSRFRVAAGLGVIALFTTTLHATVLGVFMTIAPTPWYPDYVGRTDLWGWSALEDQQLAGLIMWMPACVSYALVAIILLAKIVEEHEVPPLRAMLQATAKPLR